MAIKHFNHTHNTVAEVRACTANPQPVTPEQAYRTEASARLLRAHTSSAILANLTGREYRPAAPQAARRTTAVASRTATRGTAPAHVTRPAHPGRIGFAKKLIEERDTNMISAAADEVLLDLGADKLISADEIALLIENLLAAPRRDSKVSPAQRESLRDMAARLPMIDGEGRYAIRTEGTEDEIHYYRVTRTERGYVKVQEQASDTLYPMSYRRSADAVREILKDAQAAQTLYAATLERCYACGRTLTDATSRELGIGPDCRTK